MENVNVIGTNDPTSQENVGSMLPVIGLNGEPLTKKMDDEKEIALVDDKIEDLEDDNNILGFSESVFNYIKDDDAKYDFEVRESVEGSSKEYETEAPLSEEVKKTITTIAVLRAKIKSLKVNNEDGNKKKIIDLKREVVALTKKLNVMMKNASKEQKRAAKKLSKESYKSAIKDIKDNKDEEEVKESVEDDDYSFGVAVAILAGSAILTAAAIKISLKEKKERKNKIKKIEKVLSKNKKFIPVTEMDTERYTIKWKNGEYIPDKKVKGILKDIKASVSGYQQIYSYKGKKIFAYTVLNELSDHVTYVPAQNGSIAPVHQFDTKVLFNLLDKSMKEFEEYYMVITSLNTGTDISRANSWMEKFMKKHEKELSEVKESVEVEDTAIITEKKDEEEKKEIPPELKRLDMKRAKLENLKDDLKKAQAKLIETGDTSYEKRVKGLTYKIDKLKKEIEDGEKKVEKLTKESSEELLTEAANMEAEIKPIVAKLNEKGYKVKYASPGHSKLRKKEDKEPDGVYYDKLYSDARIMFKDLYKFPDAPKYWHWREVDGCSYLDISPISYNKKDGTPDEAFAKWKDNYMYNLKEFVDKLKDNNSKEVKESVDVFAESMMEDIFSKMGFDELEFTESVVENIVDPYDKIIDEMDEFLS